MFRRWKLWDLSKNYWKRKGFYERRETEKNYKIDWTIFYSKPRIQILGILIFLDIMLLFTVKKEIEKGFNVSSVSTSIVLFILFILLNGLFIFYYKNKFPNIEDKNIFILGIGELAQDILTLLSKEQLKKYLYY